MQGVSDRSGTLVAKTADCILAKSIAQDPPFYGKFPSLGRIVEYPDEMEAEVVQGVGRC